MRRTLFLALLALGVGAAGCDDPTFEINPILVRDTVDLAAPTAGNAGIPTALDVHSVQGAIGGGRFPERVRDAEAWDLAIRVRGGELVFVPAGALGLSSRAALTPPILGRTFEQVVEAPGQVTFRADTAIAIQVGEVYAVRSREAPDPLFGGICQQFAKVQPLEVDVAQARVRVRVTTNERCGDPRLAEEG